MAGLRPSILVVDDDPSLRLLCRVNLELEGFHVREAASADEARAAVSDARPDAVLLDVHLKPSGGSLELLDELRADGMHVALVTGTVDLDDLRGRADEVLAKPFLPDALVATARRLATVASR
jgi:two-component system OmpR family response regulator